MPLSLVLFLQHEQELPADHLGRQVQAWFLGQIERYAPSISQELHDVNGNKPYTVSGIIDPKGGTSVSQVRKNQGECCLRVTVFNENLEDLVLNKLIPGLPKALKLWWVELKIMGATINLDDHPWAGQATFAEITRLGSTAFNDQYSLLEFTSPTCFRSNGVDTSLPLPRLVFRSYMNKWNQFAPLPLQIDPIWPQFVADCVLVSRLNNLNTARWKFADGARGAATGFTGKVEFLLLPKKKCGQWQDQWDGASHVMQVLTKFAFFCGTGHHTTIGLGQTRVIEQQGRLR